MYDKAANQRRASARFGIPQEERNTRSLHSYVFGNGLLRQSLNGLDAKMIFVLV